MNTLIRRWKARMNLSFEAAKTRAKEFGGIIILMQTFKEELTCTLYKVSFRNPE